MMDEFVTKLPPDVKEYISEMGYNGSQTGLFLLGYLIGQIGSEQHKASPGATKKPILNKLNFVAMSFSKIQRLSNEIFEKLEEYKILYYNEGVFATMRELLDKNRECWRLTPQENVYYLLGGYAYATWKAIRGGT